MGSTQYSSAYIVVICAAPLIVLTGVYVWVNGILSVIKKTYLIGVTLSISTALNLVLDFFLISRYGWYGAIAATNLSYLISVSILLFFAVVHFKVRFERRKLNVVFAIALILSLLSILSFYVTHYVAYCTIILIPILPFLLGFFDSNEKKSINELASHLSLRLLKRKKL